MSLTRLQIRCFFGIPVSGGVVDAAIGQLGELISSFGGLFLALRAHLLEELFGIAGLTFRQGLLRLL